MTTDFEVAKRVADDFETETQQYLPSEPDDAEPVELSAKPTTEQIALAIGWLRGDLSRAIAALYEELGKHREEIAKLKGHRHDTTKAYSGRPEL